jgi:ketosteroid isomerase-like protein
MRYKLLLGIWVLGGALAGAQQQGTGTAAITGQCADPAARQAAQRIVEVWKDGYNGGDAARVGALYSEDAYYLTQHFVTGILHGRAAIQAYVQRGIDARFHLDALRILSVGCSPEMMYAITRYESTNAGQKAFGVNLVVLRRAGAEWKIVAHEAAVPDVATAVQSLDLPAGH